MENSPVMLSFLIFCLCPGGLLGLGFAGGWFIRGRGGMPRLYWPTPEGVDDTIE